MGSLNDSAGAQANKEWTWVSGSSTATSGGNAGVYGTQAVAAAQNVPGGRTGFSTWTDQSGDLWLFGGVGPDSAGTSGLLNDLWKFNPGTNEWTWVRGSATVPQSCSRVNTCGQPGAYGTLGAPSATNGPDGRQLAATWTDARGNLWLFGGAGRDSSGQMGDSLNDLWEFSPATGEWAWMGGVSTYDFFVQGSGTAGVYGTLGVPAPGNVPGGRTGAVSWMDSGGNLWLFGGDGEDSTGGWGYLNDLWEYTPSTAEWTWRGGASTLQIPDPSCSGGGQCEYYAPGVYGTLGVAAAGNVPPGRTNAVAWTDDAGNAWLFGGQSYSAIATSGSTLNDLWKWNPSTNLWTWMGGSDTAVCTTQSSGYAFCGQAGVYGVLGTPGAGNIPGGRAGAVSWKTSDGNMWLFGGWGFDSTISDWGWLNDLWEYQPSLNQWVWVNGSSLENTTAANMGVYGTQGVAGASNIPGARESSNGWVDSGNGLWLFGGWGMNSTPASGILNDLWLWQVAPEAAATPAFSIAGGTYTSVQTVALSDSTPGAVIYYTTDGTAPTANSTLYSGAIPVGASETLRAVAVAKGYSDSEVASAAYTINLPPPTFTLAISAPSLTIKSSQQGILTVTVAPQNGFGSVVTFACSGLASGASCAFSPQTVTPGGGAVTTTLTITAQTLSAGVRREPFPSFPATGLALMACLLGFGRKMKWGSLVLLMAGVLGVTVISGCEGVNSGTTPSPTPTPVTSTVTVTATSAAIQQTATLSLSVD